MKKHAKQKKYMNCYIHLSYLMLHLLNWAPGRYHFTNTASELIGNPIIVPFKYPYIYIYITS